MVLAPSNTLFIEIGGTVAGTDYDQLSVAGNVTVDGTLDVSVINEFTPMAGDKFEIITAESNITGTFDDELLPSGYVWNVDYGVITADTLTLEVLALLGDMNGDNMLTDADVNPFVQALTDRAAYDSAHPLLDADINGDVNGDGAFNLGDVGAFKILIASQPASANAAAVPELSTLLLAMISIALLLGRRRMNSFVS